LNIARSGDNVFSKGNKKMNEKWVICLGAGDSQVSLIRNAQLLGYRVIAIDRNPKAPGFKYADKSLIESTHNSSGIISKISGKKWYGSLARCTGDALFTAADIAMMFNLPGLNHELASIATSKSAMRKFSRENNIKVPHGIRVSSCEDFRVQEFDNQIIIKPDFTVIGKKSIAKVDSSDFVKVNNAIESALLASGNEYVEVEDFIEGYDCSYLAWIENGISTTLITWDELIGFDESFNLFQFGVSTPSISVAINQSKKIEKVIENFSKLIPDVCTLVAFSFRVDAQGVPWLIEVHADMTGDLILDELAPAATGCNFLLEITKLFIKGESSLDFNLNNDFITKPAALLYKSKVDNGVNDLVLSEDDIFLLHDKINSSIKGTVLEQKRFLDQGERLLKKY